MSGDQRILDCTSPGFIKRYFATSRLHHLSTWKADLADYVIGQMKLNNRSSAVSSHKASLPDEPFRTIMHVDMDCFFASVGVRDRPHLLDKAVAVAHSQGGVSLDYSTSEIASCNYEARAKGVKNGMFIGSAKELAPDLIIIPYEFDKYDSCSKALYHTLLSIANFVQSVSIDEAYIDVTCCVQKRLMEPQHCANVADLQARIPQGSIAGICEAHEAAAVAVANQIRDAVYERTRCHASVGIGGNLLLARIATQKAKPNGVFSLLRRDTVLEHLRGMPIRSLPGVGSSLSEKCELMELVTCGDVQEASRAGPGTVADLRGSSSPLLFRLRKELGEKTGENLYSFCWGLDERVLENRPRQTVGADINWGIRFTNAEQVESFLKDFSEEVFSRLDRAGHTAKQVTVDVKKKLYEGEPGKFLGCGHCLDLSKSMTPGRAIASADALYRCVSMLYKEIGLQPLDVRGIGIHLKKLQQGGGGEKAVSSAGASSVLTGSIAGYFGKQRPDALEPDTRTQAQIQECRHGGAGGAGVADGAEVEGDDDCSDRESENILEANRRSNQYGGIIAAPAVADYGGYGGGHTFMNSNAKSEPARQVWCGASSSTRSVRPAPSDSKCEPRSPAPSSSSVPPAQQAKEAMGASRQDSDSTTQQGVGGRIDAKPAHQPQSEVCAPVPAPGKPLGEHHVTLNNLRMEDVDLDVFSALPEDIQRELQQAFTFAQRRSTDNAARAGGHQTIVPMKTTAPPNKPKRAMHSTSGSAKASGSSAAPSSKRSKTSSVAVAKADVVSASSNKQGTLDMWRVAK